MRGATGGMHWPSTPGMMDIQETRRLVVKRRIATGLNTFGEHTWAWQDQTQIDATVHPVSGRTFMTAPGLVTVITHQLAMHYYEDPRDHGYIVRPKDILVDERGRAFFVEAVVNEGDANVWLKADLRQGVLNQLMNLQVGGQQG